MSPKSLTVLLSYLNDSIEKAHDRPYYNEMKCSECVRVSTRSRDPHSLLFFRANNGNLICVHWRNWRLPNFARMFWHRFQGNQAGVLSQF